MEVRRKVLTRRDDHRRSGLLLLLLAPLPSVDNADDDDDDDDPEEEDGTRDDDDEKGDKEALLMLLSDVDADWERLEKAAALALLELTVKLAFGMVEAFLEVKVSRAVLMAAADSVDSSTPSNGLVMLDCWSNVTDSRPSAP
jgi:hypothetical protein